MKSLEDTFQLHNGVTILQMGFLPLPKSANPDRIRENAALFDFELFAEDVAALAAMPSG